MVNLCIHSYSAGKLNIKCNLVPRPEVDEEEKGSGLSRSRMHLIFSGFYHVLINVGRGVPMTLSKSYS